MLVAAAVVGVREAGDSGAEARAQSGARAPGHHRAARRQSGADSRQAHRADHESDRRRRAGASRTSTCCAATARAAPASRWSGCSRPSTASAAPRIASTSRAGSTSAAGLRCIRSTPSRQIAPPDSLLADLDALVFDLQDIGTRTWTYVGSMIYTMRAAARHQLPIIVLDRPNPITGDHVDGPMLDTALSNPEEHTPQRPGKPYALYPFPLRHGMTMGELALFYNGVLGINAPLHVVPVAGGVARCGSTKRDCRGCVRRRICRRWRARSSIRRSSRSRDRIVSVGRGTSRRVSALRRAVAERGARRRAAQRHAGLPGVRFVVDSFTPRNPGDDKFDGVRIPGVRIDVTDRERGAIGRVSARRFCGRCSQAIAIRSARNAHVRRAVREHARSARRSWAGPIPMSRSMRAARGASVSRGARRFGSIGDAVPGCRAIARSHDRRMCTSPVRLAQESS